MSKFIFENKEEYNLEQCIGCGESFIIDCWTGIGDGELEVLFGGEWKKANKQAALSKQSVYRVLAKPFTLDDAIKGLMACEDDARNFHAEQPVLTLKQAVSIVNKLAESLGGDK